MVWLVIIYSYSLAVKVKSWMSTGHYLTYWFFEELDTVHAYMNPLLE